MSEFTLVTYATRYGSTQEVAEAIAKRMDDLGIVVDLYPMRDIHTLDKYQAVVLGAPIYLGKWHRDAHRFVSIHWKSLSQCPVALFALGPIEPTPEQLESSQEQLHKDLTKYPWLDPAEKRVFVGKYDPSQLTFSHHLISILPASPLKHLQTSDHRDWDAIRVWADTLPEKLNLIQQPV